MQSRASFVLVAVLGLGCSDKDLDDNRQNAAPGSGSVFAFLRGVQTPDEWQGYLHITDSITLPADSLDDAKAREFQGDVFASAGALFASDGGNLTKYEVNGDGGWGSTEELSFSDYPIGEDGANFYFMFRVDEHTTYL